MGSLIHTTVTLGNENLSQIGSAQDVGVKSAANPNDPMLGLGMVNIPEIKDQNYKWQTSSKTMRSKSKKKNS